MDLLLAFSRCTSNLPIWKYLKEKGKKKEKERKKKTLKYEGRKKFEHNSNLIGDHFFKDHDQQNQLEPKLTKTKSGGTRALQFKNQKPESTKEIQQKTRMYIKSPQSTVLKNQNLRKKIYFVFEHGKTRVLTDTVVYCSRSNR